jgi:hypothetical protein
MLKYVDESARIPSVQLLVLSGGEPFLLGNDLDVVVARAQMYGLRTRVVTNGYWAKSYQLASDRLARLTKAGLTELNLSTGDFHAEFVPLERVAYGARAAIDQGMSVVVMVERFSNRRLLAEDLKNNPLIKEVLDDKQTGDKLNIVESPWMERGATQQGIGGRSVAAGEVVLQEPEVLVNMKTLASRRGCTSVLNTLTITPYERVGACCGLPREEIAELDIGSAREQGLAGCYETGRNDFIKVWLAVEGPEHILAWAAEHDKTIEWENRYGHQCEACRAVYKDPKVAAVIKLHYKEKVPDVLLQFAALDRVNSSKVSERQPITSEFYRA